MLFVSTSTASMSYRQLEDFINKWTLELEEQEAIFLEQATQVNAWDRLLIHNGDKVGDVLSVCISDVDTTVSSLHGYIIVENNLAIFLLTVCFPVMILCLQIFTARCYAEHGIAMASCLSVRLSITLRYCDYIGWKSSKIISWLVSLGRSLFATPSSRGYSKGNTPKFLPE